MEMTLMELQIQVAASGLDMPKLKYAKPSDFRPLIDAQIRSWAGGIGGRNDFEYGEEFRRVRFGGIERVARTMGQELPDDL